MHHSRFLSAVGQLYVPGSGPLQLFGPRWEGVLLEGALLVCLEQPRKEEAPWRLHLEPGRWCAELDAATREAWTCRFSRTFVTVPVEVIAAGSLIQLEGLPAERPPILQAERLLGARWFATGW